MFFKRIGPKNSWSLLMEHQLIVTPLSLNIFIHYLAVKWKVHSEQNNTKFFTGNLWTLVNHCYEATRFSCAFKHDNILNTYNSNSATLIDLNFFNVRAVVMEILLYLGHPCLVLSSGKKIICLYNSIHPLKKFC